MDSPVIPQHEWQGLQHPVKAVEINLRLAIDIMKQNDAIKPEDWKWFREYLEWARENTPLWELESLMKKAPK